METGLPTKEVFDIVVMHAQRVRESINPFTKLSRFSGIPYFYPHVLSRFSGNTAVDERKPGTSVIVLQRGVYSIAIL